jgi:hypothetical protein
MHADACLTVLSGTWNERRIHEVPPSRRHRLFSVGCVRRTLQFGLCAVSRSGEKASMTNQSRKSQSSPDLTQSEDPELGGEVPR